MEPGQVEVMEPVLRREAEIRPGWVYQVKWDGIRMLSFVQGKGVSLQTKGGRVRTGDFMELNALSKIKKGLPLVLDGEIVALRNGRADFTLVLKRNFGNHSRIPIWYMVFDILMYQGRDLRGLPLGERQAILQGLEYPESTFVPVENFDDGRTLSAKTKELGWEGIVAKNITSPYVPGKSVYWEKVKNILQEQLPIIGYTEKEGQFASLLLAKDYGTGLEFAGAVGTGFTSLQRRHLLLVLTRMKASTPPVEGIKKKPSWHWIEPIFTAQIQFCEWTPDLIVRAPVFKSMWMGDRRIELP